MFVLPVQTFEEGMEILDRIVSGDIDRTKCVLFLNEDNLAWGRCMNLANGFRGILLSHEQIQISIKDEKVRNPSTFLKFWNLCTDNFCSFFPRDNDFQASIVEIKSLFNSEPTLP